MLSSDYTDQGSDLQALVTSTRWQNVTALVPSGHRLTTDGRLDRFILHYIRYDGARAVRLLRLHRDTPFSAQGLWQAMSGLRVDEPYADDDPEDPSPFHQDTLLESSIPVTDEHCLAEINRELGRLLRQREVALALRMDIRPLDEEIASLRKYLRSSSYPDGRLRSFPTTNRRAWQALSLAIKRFRERAADLDPELSDHIETHLSTSPAFVWHSLEKGERSDASWDGDTG